MESNYEMTDYERCRYIDVHRMHMNNPQRKVVIQEMSNCISFGTKPHVIIDAKTGDIIEHGYDWISDN